MYRKDEECAAVREDVVPRGKSRLQWNPKSTSCPGKPQEKRALSGKPATHSEPSPHSNVTPQAPARVRALQVTARSRIQSKPSQKVHQPEILEKVELADKYGECCKSVVIPEPAKLLEERKTLAVGMREVNGKKTGGANTATRKSAGGGAEDSVLSTSMAGGKLYSIPEEGVSSGDYRKIAAVSKRRERKKQSP